MLARQSRTTQSFSAVGTDWQQRLLSMARYESSSLSSPLRKVYQRDIEACYAYCARVTEYHSKSFFLASGLLPGAKRSAVRALYAFCRTTDDIVDMSSGVDSARLERWRTDIKTDSLRFNDPVAIAWAHTRDKYTIPSLYSEQLIDGVRMDLSKRSYSNFDELAEYCYKVASTVGLMSMHIVGFASNKAVRYAIELGVALQLTNILRDIAEDWSRGRVYLPADEMEQYGITYDHIQNGIVDQAWKEFMSFQIERARDLYERAWPGIQLLDSDGRLAIGAAATFYRQILAKIEAMDYDVFTQRAHVSKWVKLRQLPDLFIKFRYANSLNSFLS